jgi:hypothetical protein
MSLTFPDNLWRAINRSRRESWHVLASAQMHVVPAMLDYLVAQRLILVGDGNEKAGGNRGQDPRRHFQKIGRAHPSDP